MGSLLFADFFYHFYFASLASEQDFPRLAVDNKTNRYLVLLTAIGDSIVRKLSYVCASGFTLAGYERL